MAPNWIELDVGMTVTQNCQVVQDFVGANRCQIGMPEKAGARNGTSESTGRAGALMAQAFTFVWRLINLLKRRKTRSMEVELSRKARNYFGESGLHLITAQPILNAAEAISPI